MAQINHILAALPAAGGTTDRRTARPGSTTSFAAPDWAELIGQY